MRASRRGARFAYGWHSPALSLIEPVAHGMQETMDVALIPVGRMLEYPARSLIGQLTVAQLPEPFGCFLQRWKHLLRRRSLGIHEKSFLR